jgi:nucleoside-diphosphate-sugar epimerase
MKAFLTGATGFVGWHLLQALLARGDRVRCLVRPSSRSLLGGEPAGRVETVIGDLGDPEVLTRGIDDCEVVFHWVRWGSVPTAGLRMRPCPSASTT